MRRLPTLTAIASLLLLTHCDFVGEIGSLIEDPAQGEVEPVAVQANPSGQGYSTMASMPPCGTVLASFDGSEAYSNGVHTSTGYSCGGSGASGLFYQCPELIQRHFKRKWGFRWYGHAKDLLNNAPSAQVAVYSNGDSSHPPVPGDALVWTNGEVGHVALVTAVRSDAVEIIEQNVKGNGRATLPYSNGRIGARWGSWVPAGWAHARANSGAAPAPTTAPAPAPEPQPAPAPTPAPATSCHPGSVFGLGYCSKSCPCGEGEGDCDSDAECKPGLVCAADVGADFGAASYLDICRKPAAPTPTPKPTPAPATGTCSSDASGDHGDSCAGTAAEQWRCVDSPKWGVPISQVCRGGIWQTFNLNPKDCGSCCGAYTSACAD